MRKTVELRAAYQWTCEECGRDAFIMPVKAEFGPDEREEAFRHFHFMEAYEPLPERWDEFEMVQVPETVTCEHCGSVYNTVDEHNTENDDD